MDLKRFAAVGAVLFFATITAADPAPSSPATICDDPALLVETKTALAAGKGPQDALTHLKHAADALLKLQPTSVMDKAVPGPSGDKHDYVSFAPYFWPNPDKPDGLPYIRKDGYRNNKQVALGDAQRYEHLHSAIHTLGLAYWYTGDDAYAAQAAKMIHTWFLDPATHMNPNFQYAQAELGTNDGRGTGLIENMSMANFLDGLTLLKVSKSWTADDEKAMRSWLELFDTWMTTSKNGQSEKLAKNNHGSWYAVQEAALDIYLGKPDQAKLVLEAIKARITAQIQPDGRQPLEIARQDGYSYSVMNLRALATLAEIGRRNGVDLWKYEDQGRGIKQALDFLLPFASGQEPWKTTQLKKITPDSLIPTVARAAAIYGDKQYTDWLELEKDSKVTNYLLSGDP